MAFKATLRGATLRGATLRGATQSVLVKGNSLWPAQLPITDSNRVTLYLRNTTTNGISIGGVPCYDLLTTAGSSADTAVVNTTASGTEIQFTKTAGGSVAAFITGRVPVGGWTITSSDIALWLQESAATVNAGLRFRLFKYSGGTETELGGSPFDEGTEFGTANTLETLVGNVTDTALAEDDRLLLRIYATNIGTMAVGTATLSFNGAVGVGGGGTPELSGSYVNETVAVNLTTLGVEDYLAISSVGTTIRKTGGGSLLTAVPWDFVSNVSSATNNDGADQNRQFTTTDATPSNITADTGGQYTTSFSAAARNGWKITAPAGLGQRTLKVYLGHFYTTGALGQLHLTATISGSGAPANIDILPSQNVNADTELTATITYAAGQAGQTITLEYRPDAEASDGLTRYLAFRAAWVSGEGPVTPKADSYLNVYPAVTFKAEGGGTQFNSALAGSLSFAGNVAKKNNKSLTGALTFIGAVTKNAGKLLNAVLNFSGTLTPSHLFTVALNASLAFAGSVAKKTNKALGGGLSFIGAKTKAVTKNLTGALSFIGAVNKRISRSVAATLNFTSALTISRLAIVNLTAALSFSGSITRQTRKGLTANLAFIGGLSRLIQHSFTAALNFIGSMQKRTSRALSASLSFAGSLVKTVNKVLNAGLNFSGAIIKRCNKALAAAVSFIGNLVTTFIGAGGILYTIAFTASLNFSGGISKRTNKSLAASVSFMGAISKRISKTLTATLSFIGNLATLFSGIISNILGRRHHGSNLDEHTRSAGNDNSRASINETGRHGNIQSGTRAGNSSTSRRR